jgi:DNA invertase Pin-like site-specific DNA recombinase
MKIGYARVSTDGQDTNGQVKELKKVCTKVREETASGGRWDRPELQKILKAIQPGDVLVVTKLDRLTRSLSELLQILKRLEEREAGFQSLTESIDTTTPLGRMLMHILGSFAEFEREMIRERTRAGLKRARDEGRIGGRPKLNPKNRERALAMIDEGKSQSEVAQMMRVHRATICRLVQDNRRL